MIQPAHTIGKLVFNLEMDDLELERTIRQEINGWLNNGGEKEIDVVLNQFCPKGEFLLLDRLEIDLGSLTADLVPGQIGKALLKGLQDGLRKSLDENKASMLSQPDESLAIFLYYLEFGLLPWWARFEGTNELEARALTAASGQPQQFLKAIAPLARHPLALKRLTMQFSDRFSLELIKILFPSLLAELSYLNHILPEAFLGAGNFAGKGPEDLKQIAMELIWQTLLDNRKDQDTDQVPARIVQSFIDKCGLPAESMKQRIPSKISLLVKDDSVNKEKRKPEMKWSRDLHPDRIYIDNAGLVLLWPFFSAFFSSLGLLEDGKFRDSRSHVRALGLTHFLVFGGQSFEETRMALNKILLGWPLEEPVGRLARLGREEKKACMALLEEAIGQWKALKSTSVTGLRQGFLERKGILHHENKEWILNIERSGADILLATLPWPYQLVRLPWMAEPLVVA